MRSGFRRRALRWSDQDWARLAQLIAKDNPGFEKVRRRAESKNGIVDPDFTERMLENKLAKNLRRLEDFGYDVKLYVDTETGRPGKQFPLPGYGIRLDLLCVTQGLGRRFVVIEVKKGAATTRDVGQLQGYLEDVRDFFGKKPLGLIISRGATPGFERLTRQRRNSRVDFSDLGM